MEERIPTALWVAASVRRCAVKGLGVYVIRKGAEDSGTVIIKSVPTGKAPKLYNQTRNIDGKTVWLDVFEEETVDEGRIDQYIHRSIGRDPDVWVIELEAPIEEMIL